MTFEMYPETRELVIDRLINDYHFKLKSGNKYRGRCPDCNHKEASAWIHSENPWVVFCPRKKECGHENHVRELFPDLFEKWEKRFEPTPEEPNRTVNAYLVEGRGFPLEPLKGLYTQENRVQYNPKVSTVTLRFPITDLEGVYGWWERVLDDQGVFDKTYFMKNTETWNQKGHAWLTPNTNYIESKEVWITEGIFDTIALWLSGITSFSALTCNNYPFIFLNEIARKCAESGAPLPKLVWAFDNDKAGHDGIIKNIELAQADGFECEVALPPYGRKKQDWNDLYKQDRLKFTDLETYKYYGALLVAEKAVDKGILIYKRHGTKSFPFDFQNQTYWFKLDMEKYDEYMKDTKSEANNNEDWAQEEKDFANAERRDSALEYSSNATRLMKCKLTPLYKQNSYETDESWYFFKIDRPWGQKAEKNTFTGGQLASSAEFKKRLMSITPAVYKGSGTQLDHLLDNWLDGIHDVELINYVGYHKDHQTYMLGDLAVQNGRLFNINKEDYFELPRKLSLKARMPFPLEINSKVSEYNNTWVKDLLDAYDVRGMVALTGFFGSLFAYQIKSMHKSFPFLELVGEPGTGKSTLLVFLWKLFGRSGYEGIDPDPSKTSMAGLLRTFRQVSNLPVVLLESDREGDKGTVKQFDWNFLKTLYDFNGSLGAKGVKNGGNETYEPPFMGTLIISQNAEIVSTEAVMGRIVQYKFSKEQMSKKGLYASRNLERYELSEISQFILLCVEKEKAIMEAYRLGMEKYDEILHQDKFDIKSSRVIHNHAQFLALFDALCLHVLVEKDAKGIAKSLIPEDIQKKVRTELFQMAQNRDKVLKSDPIIVQNFWNTVEEMENSITPLSTKDSVVNHHAKSNLYFAVNFAQLYRVAADYRYQLPNLDELQHALRHSVHYRFIEANKMVASKIDGKSKRCWVFEKPTSQRGLIPFFKEKTMNKAIYQLNISTPSCMKASLPVSGEVANYLSTRLVNHGLIQRNELLQKLDYPKGVGSQKGSFLDSVYNFANAILAESNSPTFTVQIEAIPAYQKIFYSADDLPIADKPLIVVFKDKDIISAEYCSKHEAWHTQHGNINVRQIHQWAYVEDFYNQLNLPEFPERSKRPDPSELIKGLKGLFDALSDAAVEVHVHKVNSKGNSLKDMFDEVFGEKSDIFKSNSKH